MKKYLLRSYKPRGSSLKTWPREAHFDRLADAKKAAVKRSNKYDVRLWRVSDRKLMWSRDAGE